MASVLRLVVVFASWIAVVSSQVYIFPDATTFWVNGSEYLMYFIGTRGWLNGTSVPRAGNVSFTDPRRTGESVAVHYAWNLKVISERGTKTIAVYQSTAGRAVFAHVGTSPRVGHVTVDWLSNNVYWTDPGFGWIGLQALKENLTKFQTDGHLKVVVSSSLDSPYGVTVLPLSKRLFWSDHGENPKLESSDLLGQDRRVLVWQGLYKPTGLSADHTTRRVYWVDEVKGTVESCDQAGQGRRIIVSLSGSSLLGGLQVFEDDVIVSERIGGELQAYHKDTGHKTATPVTGAVNAGDVAVFSATLQPRDNETCNSSSCDHICIHDGGCVCSSGYALETDGRTCTERATSLWKSFLVSTRTRICAVPVNLLFSHPYLTPSIIDRRVMCFVDKSKASGDIAFLSVDSLNATLYYNTGRGIRRFYIQTGEDKEMYSATEDISGMAYDWLSGTLVWTHQSPLSGVIYGLINNLTNPVQLYQDVNRPSHITVDSYRGRMFWIEEDDGTGAVAAQIWSGTVNGSQSKVSVLSTGLKRPRHLTYDHKTDKLYWLDLEHVGVIDPDGTNEHINDLNPVNTVYRGLAIFRSYMVWSTTETGPSQMTFRNVELEETDNVTTFSVSTKIDGVTDIVFYDASVNLDSGMVFCELDNGGCSQLCIVEGTSHHCRCHFGFRLHQDGVTCFADHSSTNFFLVADTLGNRLYQITGDGKNVSAVPVQNGVRPELVVFNWVSGDIIWYDSEAAAIKSSSLDGSAVRVVISLREAGQAPFNSVGSLCLDHSTGNLFFTEIKADNSKGWIRVISLHSQVTRRLYQSASSAPRFLALAPSQGSLVFGTDAGSIYLSDMSMEGTISVLKTGIGQLSGLVFSDNGSTVQWTDDEDDGLWRMPINTLSVERRLYQSGSHPRALAAWGSTVYFLTDSGRTIIALSSSGMENAVAVFPEFGRLSSLQFFGQKAPEEVTSCSKKNGRCSTLCLPTFSSQRQCQCADDVTLLSDKRTCSDVERCPIEVKNGQMATDCDRYPQETCTYTCDADYAANPSAPAIRCGASGRWNASTDGLCLRTCPRNVPNGQMGAECPLVAGMSCHVTCDEGFEARTEDGTIKCEEDGQWSVSADRLCQDGETLPVYAIALISAGGVAIIAVLLGCCVYRRMKKYGGRDNSSRRFNGLEPNHGLSSSIWVTDERGTTVLEGGATGGPGGGGGANGVKKLPEDEEGEYAELESLSDKTEARYSSFSKISPRPGRKDVGRPRSPLWSRAEPSYVQLNMPPYQDSSNPYNRSLTGQLPPGPATQYRGQQNGADWDYYLSPASLDPREGGGGGVRGHSRADQWLMPPEPHRYGHHPSSHTAADGAFGGQEPDPDYIQVIPPSPRPGQHGAREALPLRQF